MKLAIVDPQTCHVRGLGGAPQRGDVPTKALDFGGQDLPSRPTRGRDVEAGPEFEDFFEVADGRPEDAHASVPLETDHATRGKPDEALSDRRPRNVQSLGKICDRAKAPRHKRIAKHRCAHSFEHFASSR